MASHLVVRASPPFRVPQDSGNLEGALTRELERDLARDMERESRALLNGPELERARSIAQPRPGTSSWPDGSPSGSSPPRCWTCRRRTSPPATAVPGAEPAPHVSHGRPGYLLRGAPAPLLLSLSRAAGWTLLAAVVDPEPGLRLGIDAEDPARTDFEGFDAVVLTPAERLDLAGLSGASLLQARARLWARKEAWLKMTGTGLQTAPHTVDVLAGGKGSTRLRDLPPAETGLPANLVAAVALAD